jgi:hypothetical protein
MDQPPRRRSVRPEVGDLRSAVAGQHFREPQHFAGLPTWRRGRKRVDPSLGKVVKTQSVSVRSAREATARPRATGSGAEAHGGLPPAFDTKLYKRRNVVERCRNRVEAAAWHRDPVNTTGPPSPVKQPPSPLHGP